MVSYANALRVICREFHTAQKAKIVKGAVVEKVVKGGVLENQPNGDIATTTTFLEGESPVSQQKGPGSATVTPTTSQNGGGVFALILS